MSASGIVLAWLSVLSVGVVLLGTLLVLLRRRVEKAFGAAAMALEMVTADAVEAQQHKDYTEGVIEFRREAMASNAVEMAIRYDTVAEQGDFHGSEAQFVRARWLVMRWAQRMSGFSVSEIGLYLGGKHHGTVLHGIRRASELLDGWIPDREYAAVDRRVGERLARRVSPIRPRVRGKVRRRRVGRAA